MPLDTTPRRVAANAETDQSLSNTLVTCQTACYYDWMKNQGVDYCTDFMFFASFSVDGKLFLGWAREDDALDRSRFVCGIIRSKNLVAVRHRSCS